MKELIDLTAIQLRKLKLLEDKNKRLKLLVADLSLDKQIRQDVLSKKPLRLLAIEKRAAGVLQCCPVCERLVCKALKLARSSHRNESTKDKHASAINGKRVLAWVQQHLLKSLQPDKVATMDSQKRHKVKSVH